MFAIKLILVCMLAVFMGVSATPNPQQQICAKPPMGCGSQRKTVSCKNWHGCKWDCGLNNNKCPNFASPSSLGRQCATGKTCCYDDSTCSQGKPTRVPSMSPTPPTVAPSSSPTVKCTQPTAGCQAQTQGNCALFNGCFWNGNFCQNGGCAPSPEPTSAPTKCTDVPPGRLGCAGKTNAVACELFSCCSFIGGKCKFTPVTESPSPTLPKPCNTLGLPACRRRTDCKVFNNQRCIDA
jgi:hypothetical protein